MDGYVKIGTELDTKSFDAQIKEVESKLDEIEHKLKQADMGFEVGDTVKLEAQYEKLSQKLGTLKQKQADLNRTDLSNISNSLDKVGNKVESVITKVGKWAMAVFGIRTAYGLVQKAMGIISQHDDQIRTNVDYIGFVLANSLKPIVEWLIQGAYTLLTYVNYIAKAWFGVDLFANSTAEQFKKATKNAKELQKVTMGFDEMNIINDSGTTGIKDTMPSFPKPDDVPVPKWVEWIAKNGELVKNALIGIGIAIVTMKIAKFISDLLGMNKGFINLLKKGITPLLGGLKNLFTNFSLIKGLGLAVVIAGIGIAIKGVIDFIKDPSWSNFGTIITGVGVAISGVMLMTGNWVGVIAGLGVAMAGLVTKFLNQEKAIKSVKKAQEDLKKAQDDYADATDKYISAVDRQEEAMKNLKDAQDRTGLSGESLYKQTQNGTLDYKNMTDAQREVYKAYLETEKAQKELDETSKKQIDTKKKVTEATWDEKLSVAKTKGEYDEYKKSVIDAFKKGEITADEAKVAIGKAMSEMSRDSQKTFMNDLPNDIKNGLEPKKYETAGQKLSKWFSGLFDGIKTNWNKFWNSLSGNFSVSGNAYGGGGGGTRFAKGGVILPTKMASGGIINYPNHGIPLGGGRAIGGEVGAEGVIPLTDSQMMETLGKTIGRYITINANITNSMDGKVIGREVKKIQGQQDFLMNR